MSTEPEITVFRPDRPGIRKVLGDLEAEIMEVIWASLPASTQRSVTSSNAYTHSAGLPTRPS